VKKIDHWLTEGFPLFVPEHPKNLRAKVFRLIEKESAGELRRLERRHAQATAREARPSNPRP